MNDTARIFNCVRCQRQTIICTHCDRGNIYCGSICARQSRTQNHRIANQIYQKTFRGKQQHSVRQRNYRLRQKEKVTDQGSPQTPGNDLLPPCVFDEKSTLKTIVRCHFCNATVPDFFRNGHLKHFDKKNLMSRDSRNAQGP